MPKQMTDDPATWPLKELTDAMGRSGVGSSRHTQLSAELARRQFQAGSRSMYVSIAAAVVSALGASAAWAAIIIKGWH